jgi:hypothetical protein
MNLKFAHLMHSEKTLEGNCQYEGLNRNSGKPEEEACECIDAFLNAVVYQELKWDLSILMR